MSTQARGRVREKPSVWVYDGSGAFCNTEAGWAFSVLLAVLCKSELCDSWDPAGFWKWCTQTRNNGVREVTSGWIQDRRKERGKWWKGSLTGEEWEKVWNMFWKRKEGKGFKWWTESGAIHAKTKTRERKRGRERGREREREKGREGSEGEREREREREGMFWCHSCKRDGKVMPMNMVMPCKDRSEDREQLYLLERSIWGEGGILQYCRTRGRCADSKGDKSWSKEDTKGGQKKQRFGLIAFIQGKSAKPVRGCEQLSFLEMKRKSLTLQ